MSVADTLFLVELSKSITQSRMCNSFLIAVVTLLATLASASIATAQQKTVLQEHYVYDRIRVFYAIDGNCAVSPDDVDESGVPDQVENVAKQVWAAHHLYCDILKFPDPFTSQRYEGVTCIEVNIRDREEMGGGNGVAYENSQRARKIPEGKPDDRAIVIVVASQVDPIKGITPAHEMFHLIQYGTTYFKNRWYLEGQARWSEHGLAKEGLGQLKYSPKGPWPQKPQRLTLLATMTYDAEFVIWNPVAARTDSNGLLTDEVLSKELIALRYSDGSPVLKDRFLYGATVMREILIELGKQDDVAFKGLEYDSWSEGNQKSQQNNPYIYAAIMNVLRRHSPPVGPFVVPRPKR